jgi:hypothetical protein
MVAAAVSARARTNAASSAAGLGQGQGLGSRVKKSRRSAGSWVIIGVPVLLALTFAWQIAAGLMHSEIVSHDPVAVSRVSLEADPAGSRIDLVVVDRSGQEVGVNGAMQMSMREPDGTLWQTSRSLSSADFAPLPDGGLLAGRLGYSITVPSSDWVRAPRRGGAATVSITFQPKDGDDFSTVAEERFP